MPFELPPPVPKVEKPTEQDIKKYGNAELSEFFPALDDSDEVVHSMWATPESFARYVEDLSPKRAWNDSGWERGADFYGTETMGEALQLAKEGWQEGAEIVHSVRNKIIAANPLLKKPIKYGIVGSIPSVPRAVAGNPLNMRALDLAHSRKRPVITLLSSMCSSCGVSKEAINNRSAVVAAIIDQIESSGYACEVISSALSKGFGGRGNYRAATSVLVKESHQPVDVARLAFALGHSAFFRRLVFADWGTEMKNKRGLGYGLGHPGNLLHPDLAEKNVYVIPPAGEKKEFFKDQDTAATKGLEFVIEALRQQGCPAFPGASL